MNYLESRNAKFNEPKMIEVATKIHLKLLDSGFLFAESSSSYSWLESQILGNIKSNLSNNLMALRDKNSKDEIIDAIVKESIRVLSLRKYIAYVKFNRIYEDESFELLIGSS